MTSYRRVFAIGRRRPFRSITVTVVPKKMGPVEEPTPTGPGRLETTSCELKVAGPQGSVEVN